MEKQFSATDWVVFVLTLVIPSCIGIYHGVTGGRQRTTKEFLMADRKMSCLPVAVSILVSFQSAILILVSGFPDWASFLLIGVICTFYTFMATIEVGGINHIWKLNDEWDRINFWNFDADPTSRHTFWALVIGGMINWAGTYGASQASIQRFSSLPTIKDAKRAVMMNCVGVFFLLTLACLSGISVFAFYADKGCDPLSHGDIKNSNQIIPYFVSDMLGYPGVPGLFIACLFCGALSSLSSNLSSMVAVTWEDVMKPYFKNKSEENKAWITRVLVIVYGVLGIGATFLFKNLKGTVLQASLSFMGAAGGALNGLIMLGAFFPWANWKGAVAGSLTSYVITMWVGIGKYTVVGIKETLPFPNSTCGNSNHNNTDNIYSTMLPFNITDHTSEYITVFGQSVSSNAAGNELLFWCCLQNKILEYLHCGVDYSIQEIEDDEDTKTKASTIGSSSNMSALGSETFVYKL
ncbi:SLC5A8_12 [Mytilus coruscus]|uniref:SLC5A8_12 n=1 Tax=Mytilus coruscus TaxID=42192 RepID=A0A6J8C533_MYTCO|nr:SLC5A8_12 [Mytilus coruscus]